MGAPTSRVLQIPGGIAQGVLLRILVDSDTENKVANPRVPSGKSRMLQIPGPARAPVPAQRVLALGGRPVKAPINKVLHIPEGIAQRVLLRILVGGGTAVT